MISENNSPIRTLDIPNCSYDNAGCNFFYMIFSFKIKDYREKLNLIHDLLNFFFKIHQLWKVYYLLTWIRIIRLRHLIWQIKPMFMLDLIYFMWFFAHTKHYWLKRNFIHEYFHFSSKFINFKSFLFTNLGSVYPFEQSTYTCLWIFPRRIHRTHFSLPK